MFPNLSKEKMICLDIETRDPDLKEKGPGVRRNGYIVGISLATSGGFNKYYPINHEGKDNLDKNQVIKYMKEQLSTPIPKLGANILYDLDYLYHLGIKVAPPFFDIQVAEPILDENRRVYNLNSLAEEYLGIKKEESGIETYAKEKGWVGPPQVHIWKMPSSVVEPYALSDTSLPIKIFEKQKAKLEKENLWNLFLMETELLELLLYMRRDGINIDIKKAEKTKASFEKALKLSKKKLCIEDIWSARAIAILFDKHKITYPKTVKTGEPSFTRAWLDSHPDPICKELLEARKLDKFLSTFVSPVLELSTNGRIHPQIHSLRNDDWGTVSGRFSYSLPNLQQQPTKQVDPEKGPLIRSLYIPEKGEEWARADYSQVELRIFSHYAQGKGSEEMREAYNSNPFTDYHAVCMKITGLDRKPAKNITFGKLYGMGLASLVARLGVSDTEGKAIVAKYDNAMPCMRETMKSVGEVANRRGYIFTILKRRRRFDIWEPYDFNLSRGFEFSRNKKAVADFVASKIQEAIENNIPPPRSGVRRAKVYKALNSLVQGSAADLMKKAMVDIWKSGLCSDLGLPKITVHDELDFSKPKTKKGEIAFKEALKLMENAIKFKVPIIVDAELGKNWGELKEYNWR